MILACEVFRGTCILLWEVRREVRGRSAVACMESVRCKKAMEGVVAQSPQLRASGASTASVNVTAFSAGDAGDERPRDRESERGCGSIRQPLGEST